MRLEKIKEDLKKHILNDLMFVTGSEDIGILQASYRVCAYENLKESSTLSSILFEYEMAMDLAGRKATSGHQEMLEDLTFLLGSRHYNKWLHSLEVSLKIVKDVEVPFTQQQTTGFFSSLSPELKKALRFYFLRSMKVKAEDFSFKKTLEKYITYDELLKESLGL